MELEKLLEEAHEFIEHISKSVGKKINEYHWRIASELTQRLKEHIPEESSIRLIWKCKYCKDVVTSHSHLKHDMNYCECGKSAIDLEECYMRGMGDTKVISKKIFTNGKWKRIEKKP